MKRWLPIRPHPSSNTVRGTVFSHTPLCFLSFSISVQSLSNIFFLTVNAKWQIDVLVSNTGLLGKSLMCVDLLLKP